MGARGTLVIPQAIRRAQATGKGDILEVLVEGDKLVLVKERLWEKFRDSTEGRTSAERVEQELDEEDRRWERRLQRPSSTRTR